ncbi:MAG: 6-pyruvoyl tetrahydrobiopterin synthase [Dehalococcoidia bacterium DG_18]|nr:MAG: 6-pyruvoyl tetrahydrobiopterin synthase [Dehalococcoidia bacterium DG_18]
MFVIEVREHFDAAHALRGYQGKCENLHGHRFEVVVTLRATELDEIGLAYDFTELKRHLREILARFDHACLNDMSPFDKVNPSSENIATTIYEEFQKRELLIFSVQVCESADSCVTYLPDESV